MVGTTERRRYARTQRGYSGARRLSIIIRGGKHVYRLRFALFSRAFFGGRQCQISTLATRSSQRRRRALGLAGWHANQESGAERSLAFGYPRSARRLGGLRHPRADTGKSRVALYLGSRVGLRARAPL